jgi:hypothetical protein
MIKNHNNMFNKKFTKWIPLGNYSWGGDNDYIVFARKNKKTGMIDFKTKRVQGFWSNKNPFIPCDLIDVKAAWDNILSN